MIRKPLLCVLGLISEQEYQHCVCVYVLSREQGSRLVLCLKDLTLSSIDLLSAVCK